MRGGMRTEASRYYAGHAPCGACADCDWGCVPGLGHVLRECPGYNVIQTLAAGTLLPSAWG
eukprot:1887800-Alexandrium_andersonii.AAC.1